MRRHSIRHPHGHSTTLLLALGYPDPKKQYTDPISRFDADQLITFT